MDVAVYTKDHLLEKGHALIPGLGAFSSEYKSAYYDESGSLFHPPCRNYFFSTDFQADNVLAKYIAGKENITSAEAIREIEEYVKDCWYILNKGQRLQLMGVGVIYKDESGNLKFDVDPLLVRGGDFYGLESIPAQKHLPPPPPLKKSRKFPLKAVLAGFMILVVILGGVWVGKLVNIFQRKMELRGPIADSTVLQPPVLSVDTTVYDSVSTDTAADPLENVTAAEVQVPSEPAKPVVSIPESKPNQTTEATAGERYYILGGCFRSEEGAKKFNSQLIAKGYPSQVVGKTGAGLTMVSYSSHDSKEEARQALEKIRRDGDSGAYIIHR